MLTPPEEPGCFTVTSILPNLPQLPEFVVQWDYPVNEEDLTAKSAKSAEGYLVVGESGCQRLR